MNRLIEFGDNSPFEELAAGHIQLKRINKVLTYLLLGSTIVIGILLIKIKVDSTLKQKNRIENIHET
jgi:hypothetical protein